jgi:hypothetical protein
MFEVLKTGGRAKDPNHEEKITIGLVTSGIEWPYQVSVA